MVERLLCKQDVSGSSPLTSTREKKTKSLNKEIKIQHYHELPRQEMRMLDFKEFRGEP